MGELAQGQSVLDIGCADIPNPYLRGKRIVGLDLEDMKISPPYAEHVIGDVNQIDELLPGELFDVILMGNVIEHVEQPYELLRKVREHISTDGLLILSTPNLLGFPVIIAEYLCLRRFFYTANHVYYFTPRWVWRLLEQAGFHVLTTVGCGMYLRGAWIPAPVTLSYEVIYAAKPIWV
jgi:2-polyprenyl-3-methyl-5-hydroxy-6-metoxy-1,4-benzoquinol methylase